MEVFSSVHKLAREFSPPTLQQQTKSKMEKSLCMLAAVILLGAFLHAADAQMIDAETERSYSSSSINSTLRSVTVEPQSHSRHGQTATTAETKLLTTTVRNKQLDSKNTIQDSEEASSNKDEDDNKTDDEKTQLGRMKMIKLDLNSVKPERLRVN